MVFENIYNISLDREYLSFDLGKESLIAFLDKDGVILKLYTHGKYYGTLNRFIR